jgi:hypothetical protein
LQILEIVSILHNPAENDAIIDIFIFVVVHQSLINQFESDLGHLSVLGVSDVLLCSCSFVFPILMIDCQVDGGVAFIEGALLFSIYLTPFIPLDQPIFFIVGIAIVSLVPESTVFL